MRAYFILFFILMSSCGQKNTSVKMGVTTRAELVAVKGEPLKEDKIPVKDGQVMVYENDEKYQLKGDVVVSSFKAPQGDEQLLIFWKHKFKDCLTISKDLDKIPGSHTPGEIELACPESGISVIYTQGSDLISRVVEYEVR
jgi:hypothetical protein